VELLCDIVVVRWVVFYFFFCFLFLLITRQRRVLRRRPVLSSDVTATFTRHFPNEEARLFSPLSMVVTVHTFRRRRPRPESKRGGKGHVFLFARRENKVRSEDVTKEFKSVFWIKCVRAATRSS
jgi:hypothetical protein